MVRITAASHIRAVLVAAVKYKDQAYIEKDEWRLCLNKVFIRSCMLHFRQIVIDLQIDPPIPYGCHD